MKFERRKLKHNVAITESWKLPFILRPLSLSECRKACFGSVATTALLFAIIGCGGNAIVPPEIVPDRTACSKCKMLLSDTRFAAALNAGETRTFDDLGCMLTVIIGMKQQPEHIWVRAYEGNRWLDARSAVFVHAPKLGTPMNYGFVAVGDTSVAEGLARSNGGQVIKNWNDLKAFFKNRT